MVSSTGMAVCDGLEEMASRGRDHTSDFGGQRSKNLRATLAASSFDDLVDSL